jgi:peptide deformylase
MILPILTYPDKILRKPTEPMVFPLSREAKKLIQDMIDTVRGNRGIGLAAPQIGKSFKLVVVNLEKSGMPLFVLSNPKVVSKGFQKIAIEEGCLSIPGVFGMVRRPKRVKVEAQNLSGEKITFTDDGWVSRVTQHEIDHINGKLIIDHIKKYTQGEELVKQWKKESR